MLHMHEVTGSSPVVPTIKKEGFCLPFFYAEMQVSLAPVRCKVGNTARAQGRAERPRKKRTKRANARRCETSRRGTPARKCKAVRNVLLKISRYGFDEIYFTLLNFILLKTLFIKIAAAFCKNAAAKCLSCYQFLIRILTQNLILNEEILILDTGNISLLFEIFFCAMICRRKILFPVASKFFLILL